MLRRKAIFGILLAGATADGLLTAVDSCNDDSPEGIIVVSGVTRKIELGLWVDAPEPEDALEDLVDACHASLRQLEDAARQHQLSGSGGDKLRPRFADMAKELQRMVQASPFASSDVSVVSEEVITSGGEVLPKSPNCSRKLESEKKDAETEEMTAVLDKHTAIVELRGTGTYSTEGLLDLTYTAAVSVGELKDVFELYSADRKSEHECLDVLSDFLSLSAEDMRVLGMGPEFVENDHFMVPSGDNEDGWWANFPGVIRTDSESAVLLKPARRHRRYRKTVRRPLATAKANRRPLPSTSAIGHSSVKRDSMGSSAQHRPERPVRRLKARAGAGRQEPALCQASAAAQEVG